MFWFRMMVIAFRLRTHITKYSIYIINQIPSICTFQLSKEPIHWSSYFTDFADDFLFAATLWNDRFPPALCVSKAFFVFAKGGIPWFDPEFFDCFDADFLLLDFDLFYISSAYSSLSFFKLRNSSKNIRSILTFDSPSTVFPLKLYKFLRTIFIFYFKLIPKYSCSSCKIY